MNTGSPDIAHPDLRHAAAATPAASFAPGTQIAYSEELISKLTQDHQDLLALFVAIQTAGGRHDAESLRDSLAEFSRRLTGHILLENLKLYIYIQRNLQSDAESKELVKRFRKEMSGIATAVLDFVTKYRSTTNWNAQTFDVFKLELLALGEVLVKRIQCEEQDLYPLYMPVDNYVFD